ncbi:hypothetical protein Vretimale_4886 [Volvox reticuliferus]|uniref:JmjC domain-containing protein n=1 Tax=Volvox reticuliferus TaxID=1737510 RepID=A0A8J4C0Z0_9CHLO|nr:hypothetical protein Vretifemale_3513 [Volvox reticuliferus]GIL99760.1 hypothetical protein Vretimale_4886 [Volvox reticuliferus]
MIPSPHPLPADHASGRLQQWFVTPHERRMTLREFFSLMRKTRAADKPGSTVSTTREVPYMQHQNSNLCEELGMLLDDIRPGMPWAEEVFGDPPEAINIWIGDERSATSFHKDHYENLYAVIRGTKVFSLLPPCDAYRMYLTRCPAACYMPRGDVPCGAVYGEVSSQPSVNPTPRAASGAAAGVSDGGGACGWEGTADTVPDGAAGLEAEKGDPSRLVAVLQDPGYEVLWSAVDTTVQDPKARQAQGLFFGLEDGWNSAAAAGVHCGGGDVSGHAIRDDDSNDFNDTTLRGGRGRDDGREDGCDTANGSCSSGGSVDPWDTAGGAPLVVEVGPGEVLYLPALWYHQVEQYTAAERAPSSRPGGSRAAAAVTTAATGASAAADTTADHGQGQQQQAQQVDMKGDEEEYVIAVNFWYDMKYDGRYSAFKLVEGLATALGLADTPPAQEAGGDGHYS